MPQNSFFLSTKSRSLRPLSPVIFATATVVAFVLLHNSRFNFHCYNLHTERSNAYSEIGLEVMLQPLTTSCMKNYKGHSLMQTSFTEPPNKYPPPFFWGGGGGVKHEHCHSDHWKWALQLSQELLINIIIITFMLQHTVISMSCCSQSRLGHEMGQLEKNQADWGCVGLLMFSFPDTVQNRLQTNFNV